MSTTASSSMLPPSYRSRTHRSWPVWPTACSWSWPTAKPRDAASPVQSSFSARSTHRLSGACSTWCPPTRATPASRTATTHTGVEANDAGSVRTTATTPMRRSIRRMSRATAKAPRLFLIARPHRCHHAKDRGQARPYPTIRGVPSRNQQRPGHDTSVTGSEGDIGGRPDQELIVHWLLATGSAARLGGAPHLQRARLHRRRRPQRASKHLCELEVHRGGRRFH